VTLWCPLRFEFYPLDTQSCQFKIGAFTPGYLFQLDHLAYNWEQPNPLLDFVRVTPLPDLREFRRTAGGQNYSAVGFRVDLKRRPFQYIANFYLPSALFVVVSFASFLIPPDVIPGRMSLLVTLFLVLISIFNTVNSKSPRTEGINLMAFYVIVCILFVFGALFAYAVMLYKKKARITDLASLRNGSLTIAYLFPFAAVASEVNDKPATATPRELSVKRLSVSSNDHDDVSPKSNTLAPPPPPPSLPGQTQSSRSPSSSPRPTINGYHRRASSTTSSRRANGRKRSSIATMTGLIPPPKPSERAPPPPSWHDSEMASMDKAFLCLFAVLFAVFNGVYWPFLIFQGKIPFPM